ncbi:MAG: alpha/beta hydrolase [Chloroflexi bacterium]|nr:alpha/beta hydrolase [Chloroflexota bacterium]
MNKQITTSKKNRMGCLGKVWRMGAGLLIGLLFVIGIGIVFEGRKETAVSTQYPAPGQIIEVEGRNMHINCTGTGSPTIILDAGQGGWSSDWANLMPQLSQNNRVCAYDRAGYGWSDAVADNPSPQDAANDLAALLTTAQIEPPYLLVGFSHAGLADRIFAAQHADQMAGMVLIDPATEFDNEIMSAELIKQQQSAVGMFKGFELMAKVGLLRLLGTQNMADSAPFIGTNPADPDVYYTFIAAPQWWATSAQEFVSHLNDEHLAMVRDNGAIQDIPLIIIGSDTLETTGNAAMDGLQATRHEKLSALAAQSSQGEFIIAEGSTHNIPDDRPDVLLAAIESVMANR